LTCRDDPYGVVFAHEMNYEEQHRTSGFPDGGLPNLKVDACVLVNYKRIEEDAAGLFKGDAVLSKIGFGLARIPDESLTVAIELEVHV
jgi:hypothetical protein